MKKLICLVLALVLLCSLCACGKAEKEEPQKSDVAVEKQPEKETVKATEADTESDEEEVMGEFALPLAEIYCKVPEEYVYNRLTNASVATTSDGSGFVMSICCGDEGSYSGSTKDIFEFFREDYTNDVNKYLYPMIDYRNDDAWNLSYTDGAVISGYEATKIDGTVVSFSGSTYEVYGYSAIIEDRPVVFLGFLVPEEWEKDGLIPKYQPEEDRKTMIALVEQMVSSIYK